MKVERTVECIQFCEGCPAQNTYVDDVETSNVEVIVNFPPTTRYSGRVIPGHRFLNISVEAHDSDVGKSEKVSSLVHFRDIQEAGIDIKTSVKKGYSDESITYPDRVLKKTSAALAEVGPRLVSRIGRCERVGIDQADKRQCPAFNKDVLEALVNESLKPNQQ